jgi:hypothetical protein
MLSTSLKWALLRKGSRIFALLGKATASGLTAFTRQDIGRSWALTAEFGCLRLERFVGDEELTGDQLLLPTPTSYDYGVSGVNQSPDITRAVFGLLPGELEQLITSLRRGSFPMMGFSQRDLKCAISSCTIPGYWPHVVVSNTPLYGNVVSIEVFVRTLISSMPHGQLAAGYPELQPIFKQMTRLMLASRGGIPYHAEIVEAAPVAVMLAK